MPCRSPVTAARMLAMAVGVWGSLTLCVGSRAYAEVDEPVTRVSDVTETSAQQWMGAGFRLQLRLGYQAWQGLQGVPSGSGFHLSLEPAWHFLPQWSVGLDLDYAILVFGMSGLRLSLAAGPTWHPAAGLQIGLSVGYAAMLAGWSYDTPTNAAGLPATGNCDGQGALGKLRLAYFFQMSEVWATGPAVSASLSWLHCRAVSSSSIDADAYSAPWLAPWWQYDVNAMWAVTWR